MRWLLPLAWLVSAGATPERLPAGPPPRVLAPPPPPRHADAPQMPPGLDGSAESCGECHPEAYETWRQSRHAQAASNPIFRVSWLAWPNGWCLDCHAPSAQAQRDLIGRVAIPGTFHAPPEDWPSGRWEEGVTCVTCHVRDGQILTAGPLRDEATAMHPMRRDPGFGEASLCGACHQFPFQQHTPPWPFAYGDTPAQDTVREWESSHAASQGIGCVDCHMGERGHRFPGGHSPQMVRDAVQVDVIRHGYHIQATLRAPGAAHRIPTGDPFRRLELLICRDADCTKVLERARFARIVRPDEQSWTLWDDTTIPPDGPESSPVRTWSATVVGGRFYRLEYRFGDPKHEVSLSPEDVGYTLVEGVIRRAAQPRVESDAG